MKKYYITKSHTVKIKVISTMSFIKKKGRMSLQLTEDERKWQGEERERKRISRGIKNNIIFLVFFIFYKDMLN